MFFAPTDNDIQQAQAHVAALTRKRELCAKLDALKAQVDQIEAELHALPITVGPMPRRIGWIERGHRRLGLA